MDIKIELDGIIKAQGFEKYSRDFRAKLLKSTRKAMQDVGKTTKAKIQADVRSKLKIKREAFVKSFTYKVYFKKTNNIPSLHFYSAVPWVGMYTKGGSVNKKVIIPFTKKAPKGITKSKSLGTKTLKYLLSELQSHKNLFFDNTGNQTIVWAKNTKEDSRLLVNFRRAQSNGGTRIKINERVNIGVVVKNTSIKKRLSMNEYVQSSLKEITQQIELNMKL